MADYYRERMKDGKKRIDDIYDVDENGSLIRNSHLADIPGHEIGSLGSEKDKLGGYVLISDKFSYFGREAKDIDGNLLELFPKTRETKVYYSGYAIDGYEEESFGRIMDFLKANDCLECGRLAGPNVPKWEGVSRQ